MTIVKVIHGYPPRYNAGSEVYSQALCQSLVERGHRVFVFTREENPFSPEYEVHTEADAQGVGIELTLVNMARVRDAYRHSEVDKAFGALLERVRPDVIHIGHLNHLSTSLVFEASNRGIATVFTAHDFWPLCPRGQFIQMYGENRTVWPVCPGQEDNLCARQCYRRYFGGPSDDAADDEIYWTKWVGRRMAHLRGVMAAVDLVMVPSRHMFTRFHRDMPFLGDRMVCLDYGFDLKRLAGRRRVQNPKEGFVFGYIGTHIPAKGIDLLIQAFSCLAGKPRLRIWGRYLEPNTRALRRLVDQLSPDVRSRVEWREEYDNRQIVRDVFDHVDAIVVPSIWLENSPLVIHEALQARVAVVTADVGGMSEFVEHEVNGFLFSHRDAVALRVQMQRLVDDPMLAAKTAKRGYLNSPDGNVSDLGHHAAEVIGVYRHAIQRRLKAKGGAR